MLLWIEQATMLVVLWGSSVSMFSSTPTLIIPPVFGFCAQAGAAQPAGTTPDAAAADQPSARRTERRLTSSRHSSLTTSNPSRLFMGPLLQV